MNSIKVGLAAAVSALAVMAIGAASQASAATIVWNSPVNDTGNASDVKDGSFAAVTWGSDVTLNGVNFVGETSLTGGTLSFGAQPVTVSGLDVVTNAYSAPTFADPNYDSLVGGGAYASSSNSTPTTINVSGLTVGKSYQVQLFEGFWNNNWATSFTGGANTSAPVNLTGPDVGAGASSVPQYLVGSFKADGTTQDITLTSPTAYRIFGAAGISAVPEPGAWALMLLGLGGIGAAMRGARRKNGLALSA